MKTQEQEAQANTVYDRAFEVFIATQADRALERASEDAGMATGSWMARQGWTEEEASRWVQGSYGSCYVKRFLLASRPVLLDLKGFRDKVLKGFTHGTNRPSVIPFPTTPVPIISKVSWEGPSIGEAPLSPHHGTSKWVNVSSVVKVRVTVSANDIQASVQYRSRSIPDEGHESESFPKSGKAFSLGLNTSDLLDLGRHEIQRRLESKLIDLDMNHSNLIAEAIIKALEDLSTSTPTSVAISKPKPLVPPSDSDVPDQEFSLGWVDGYYGKEKAYDTPKYLQGYKAGTVQKTHGKAPEYLVKYRRALPPHHPKYLRPYNPHMEEPDPTPPVLEPDEARAWLQATVTEERRAQKQIGMKSYHKPVWVENYEYALQHGDTATMLDVRQAYESGAVGAKSQIGAWEFESFKTWLASQSDPNCALALEAANRFGMEMLHDNK